MGKALLPREPLCPLAPGPQLALLRKGNFTGFTRRREEKGQTYGFEEVIPGLKQALTLLFSPVMGKAKPGKEPVNQTQATCTLLRE